MLKFYYHPSPNPAKIALFLEEAGLAYEMVPVDTRKGEQHAPTFTALNPNAKTPVLVDGDVCVFDSNAILLYLAEKTGPEAWEKLPNVKRLLDEINARPAAQRAEALKARHVFKTEFDDEAKRAMFPQNARLAG